MGRNERSLRGLPGRDRHRSVIQRVAQRQLSVSTLGLCTPGEDEEVISAGEAYYLAPGHNVVTEEDCEIVEFSPKGEYQKTMEVAARNMAAMQQGG